MARVFLEDVALSSWELDDFSKALLPVLCRSTGVSYLIDEAGDFILEPPLGNKTIVLRPLTSPEQGLKALLTTLSQGLRDRGANVLIVPATASDGQLFRLWQTQVLFAFTQKDAAAISPAVRFFYAPRRREESLGLIAALVQAMLRSAKPFSYTIPGSWEHFKNFRYRNLLNNAEVPSVLIEFCQASLEEEAGNVAAWLVNGLTAYFQKPPAEELVLKLQSLLQRLREACLSSAGKFMPGEREIPRRTVMPSVTQEEISEPAPAMETAVEAPDPGVRDNLVRLLVAQDEPVEDVTLGATPEPEKAVEEETRPVEGKDTRVTMPGQAEAPASQPTRPATGPLEGGKSLQAGYIASGITAATAGMVNPGLAPAALAEGPGGRPARRRQRGNPFAPPGDGPVFIFKRPLEATLVPSFFPKEVLERMAPLPLQSTSLAARDLQHYQSPYVAADMARVTPITTPVARPEVLLQPPEDSSPIRTVTLSTRKDESPLAELKNLSAAILAPGPQQEPLNGEAPSN